MPAKPAWLLRIPEILHELQSLTVPVVDRSMCERLFRVRRRRAITLMQEFGACQSGRTLLLERMAMINKLEALQQGQEFVGERTGSRNSVTASINCIVTVLQPAFVFPRFHLSCKASCRNCRPVSIFVIVSLPLNTPMSSSSCRGCTNYPKPQPVTLKHSSRS